MNTSQLQILLVEDNPVDAGLLRRVLARANQTHWQMVHVETLEAMENVFQEYPDLIDQSRTFDIILLDLFLADSEGLETVVRVQGTHPDIPIVVLTSLNDEILALQAVAAGAQDYLVKDTTTIQRLTRSIHYAIERGKTLNRLRQQEQSQRQTIEQLQELNQSKADFLSFMLYEASAPLTIVQITLDMMQSSSPMFSEEQKKAAIEQAKAATKRVQHLLSELPQ